VAGSPSSRGQPGRRPAFSLPGRAPANMASSWHTLRTALWRTARSPWHEHTRAWSPQRSEHWPQQGQNAPSSDTGRRKRLESDPEQRGIHLTPVLDRGRCQPSPGARHSREGHMRLETRVVARAPRRPTCQRAFFCLSAHAPVGRAEASSTFARSRCIVACRLKPLSWSSGS